MRRHTKVNFINLYLCRGSLGRETLRILWRRHFEYPNVTLFAILGKNPGPRKKQQQL